MKTIGAFRTRARSRFTVVELLIVFVVFTILAAIFLPFLSRAKDKAKFVRWFAYNRQCANDPACIVNFNFQEGEGNTLTNICAGADVVNFKAYEYDGHLMKNNSSSTTVNNFQWLPSGGRWSKYGFKKALQFNGADTYILIPGTQGLDFTPMDEFTILCWVKFDKMEAGDCPISKSLWGTEADAAAQFDLYANPFSGSQGQGSFDVDVFETCATWPATEVDFVKTAGCIWRCVIAIPASTPQGTLRDRSHHLSTGSPSDLSLTGQVKTRTPPRLRVGRPAAAVDLTCRLSSGRQAVTGNIGVRGHMMPARLEYSAMNLCCSFSSRGRWMNSSFINGRFPTRRSAVTMKWGKSKGKGGKLWG